MDEEKDEEKEGLNVAKVESEQLQDIIDRKDREALQEHVLRAEEGYVAQQA